MASFNYESNKPSDVNFNNTIPVTLDTDIHDRHRNNLADASPSSREGHDSAIEAPSTLTTTDARGDPRPPESHSGSPPDSSPSSSCPPSPSLPPTSHAHTERSRSTSPSPTSSSHGFPWINPRFPPQQSGASSDCGDRRSCRADVDEASIRSEQSRPSTSFSQYSTAAASRRDQPWQEGPGGGPQGADDALNRLISRREVRAMALAREEDTLESEPEANDGETGWRRAAADSAGMRDAMRDWLSAYFDPTEDSRPGMMVKILRKLLTDHLDIGVVPFDAISEVIELLENRQGIQADGTVPPINPSSTSLDGFQRIQLHAGVFAPVLGAMHLNESEDGSIQDDGAEEAAGLRIIDDHREYSRYGNGAGGSGGAGGWEPENRETFIKTLVD